MTKKILILPIIFTTIFFICTISSSYAKESFFPFFLDIEASHKNFAAIDRLQKEGIINGYSDNTFKPDQTVSRSEALKILLLGSQISPQKVINKPFPDVNKDDWFAGYVVSAKEKGFINGRKDGNFVPSDSINRAEALKIMLLLNGNEGYEAEENPHLDVEKDAWFAKFFEDASYRGIFDASNKENVYPQKFLTRGELVEMMYRYKRHDERKTIDRVGVASWYNGRKENDEYIYSAAHRTLEKGKKIKVTDFTTGKSVIVKINDRGPYLPNRVLDLSKKAFEEISTPSKGLTLVEFEEVSDNTPLGPVKHQNTANIQIYKVYEPNFWDDITLDKAVFPVFRKSETVYFSGISDAQTVTIFYKEVDTGKEYNFSSPVINGKFSIPVYFKNTGKINIGFLPKSQGNVKVVPGEIFSGQQSLASEPETHQRPENFRAEVINGKVVFKWDDSNNNLFHLKFRQKHRVKNFFVRHSNQVSLPPEEFEGFENGNIFITLSGAELSDSNSFELKRGFTGKRYLSIPVFKRYPDKVSQTVSIESFTSSINTGNDITGSGNFSSAQKGAYGFYIKPFGNTEIIEKKEISLSSDNRSFSFSYPTKQKGTYIVELSDQGGKALAIIPVYPKGFFPLLPSIKDTLEDGSEKNLTTQTKELSQRINTFRKEQELPVLKEDNLLNTLAQIRADDMKKRGYFSHTTPGGKTVNDFRIDYGITVPLSENIAISGDGYSAAVNLEFSPSHRKNLVDKSISRYGVGLAKLDSGEVYVVQLFAPDKISEEDVLDLINQTRNILSSRRDDNDFVKNEVLEIIAQKWSSAMAEKSEQELVLSDGTDWKTLLQEHQVQHGVQAFIGSFPAKAQLINFFQTDKTILSSLISENIVSGGIGISLSKEGVIYIMILGKTE